MRIRGGRSNDPFAGLSSINLEGLRYRLVDAENQVVGRLAAQLSLILQGKDKPTWNPLTERGDVCIVINGGKAALTGKKWADKVYVSHTGAAGGRKEIAAQELWRKDPTEVLRRAVSNMLPKNNLHKDRMRKLRIFPGPDHAYRDFPLTHFSMPPRTISDKRLGWPLPPGYEPMNPEAYQRRMRGSRWARPAAAGSLPPVPELGFDDLLTEEERAFAAECRQQQQQQTGRRSSGDGQGAKK